MEQERGWVGSYSLGASLGLSPGHQVTPKGLEWVAKQSPVTPASRTGTHLGKPDGISKIQP